jgi:hypothetical protein
MLKYWQMDSSSSTWILIILNQNPNELVDIVKLESHTY